MRKLGGLDAMFLYNDRTRTPMHVGAVQYLEASPDKRKTFFEDLRAMLLDRLHLVPYLTSRLEYSPMGVDHPVWVRHMEFDLDQHVHRVRLPAPGTIEQVQQLAASLYEPRMDRSKPLWQIWVIEGLENGQIALLQKTHHACIDGASSVKAAELLFDWTAEPREVEPPPEEFWSDDRPGRLALWRSAFENIGNQWAEGVLKTGKAYSAGWKAMEGVVSRRLTTPPIQAPKTRLNGSIDARRSFANVAMSLSAVRTMAKQAKVKINDVVLVICGEGLRRYLARYGETPRRSLIANCPVSLHKPGEGSIKNQVSAMNVDLATGIEDLEKRLQAIHLSANGSKGAVAAFDEVMPRDFAAFGMPAMMQTMSWLAQNGLIMDLAPAVLTNVVVSNVPGFPVPIYVAGARLVGQMPMSIVVHGFAVNLTVTSYCDRMDLGLTVATRRVPDVENLQADIYSAYGDLVHSMLGPDQDLEPAPLPAA